MLILRRFACSVLTLILTAGYAAGQGSYRIASVAGGGLGVGDGGPATSAILQQAEGIAVDTLGYLYVADAAAHRVRRISPAGVIETIAGTGVAGYSGDNGPADVARLNTPYGLAVDAARTLYIADLGNQRVRRVTPDGRITTIAGGGSTPLSVFREGQAAFSVQLKSPRNVVVDADGSVIFSDFEANRVARISVTGALTTVAGTGAAGAAGDGGPAVDAQLSAPAGLALDGAGGLYIADSGNRKVRRVLRTTIASVTSSGKPLSLTSPTGVAVDSTGVLYVADAAGTQCLRVPPTGAATSLAVNARDVATRGGQLWLSGSHELWQWVSGSAKRIAGNGTASWYGDGQSALRARLSSPGHMAVDASGNIYFADEANHCVRRIDTTGIISTIAGTGQPGFSGDNGPAAAAQLQAPLAVALDPAGNLYVSDTGNHRLRRISRNGSIVTIAGTGVAGGLGDGGLATAAQLSSPAGLAADRDGSVYLADAGNHSIRKLSPAGVIDSVAGGRGTGFSGDGGPASRAQLRSPAAVAVDTDGSLVIADTGNHAIRRVNAAGVISSVADVLPSRWNAPQGVAFGGKGELWVADTGNGRIAVVTARGEVQTVAGGGTSEWREASATAVKLGAPRGLAFDVSGILLFTDALLNRMGRLSPSAVESVPSPVGPTTVPATLSFRLVHAASYQATALAPGEIVTLFGEGIGPSAPTVGTVSASGALQTQMDGRQILFDGLPAPIFYGRSDQVTVQVPYALAGRAMSEVSLLANGVRRAGTVLPLAATSPGIFTVAGGTGPAAALNQDGLLNSPSNPAATGSMITLYATGAGQMTPGGVDGRAASAPFALPVAPVNVYLDGEPAEVLWAGAAPGMVGVLQVNARIPGSVAARGAAEVMLVLGNASSPPGVTIAVQ